MVNSERTDLSCTGDQISYFSSLHRNRMGVFGKRVQVDRHGGRSLPKFKWLGVAVPASTLELTASHYKSFWGRGSVHSAWGQ